MPKLMWVFIFPFISALASFALSIAGKKMKGAAFLLSLIPLLVLLFFGVDGWIGSTAQYSWLPSLGIEFFLRVDSLSLLFLYLTNAIIPISILAVKDDSLINKSTFYGFVFILQGL